MTHYHHSKGKDRFGEGSREKSGIDEVSCSEEEVIVGDPAEDIPGSLDETLERLEGSNQAKAR